ncbi:G protein-coupled receptor 137Ba-like [Ruditapes philippinarum]|uniref:G protein-coupled receptor 137Ba-like n=1 Tax=Ruditapes philippinarum TaxID=129788 RepID=UPI00295B46E7|nr:G protein-coupled receptor 137Ba-like [Ruditapes philippinarum]
MDQKTFVPSGNLSSFEIIHLLNKKRKETITIPPITFAPNPTPGTLVPALKPRVELGLTITYISLYGVLFSMVYLQLWMIWYYRHKRFSYQTVFLFLALIWSGLRVSLFSFYFNDCARVNFFPLFLYWLMFCFPVCLQFVILCLLVLFFVQVLFKARAKYEPSRLKKPLKIGLVLVVIVFLSTNITCAAITKKNQSRSLPVYMLYLRVAINDSLFIIMSGILALCIYRMAKMSSASIVLEAKGTSVRQALIACVLILFLYLTRAVYNIVAVATVNKDSHKLPSFGYGWINVTDQADFVELDKGYAYLSFAIVLFVWEILPMFTVIIFFRVRRLGSPQSSQDVPSINHDTKAYFFDNPRRYDSDEEDNSIRNEPHQSYNSLSAGSYSINGTLENSGGSPIITSLPPHRLGYGAVTTADRNYSYSVSPITQSPLNT